jgi:hypothetical protein
MGKAVSAPSLLSSTCPSSTGQLPADHGGVEGLTIHRSVRRARTVGWWAAQGMALVAGGVFGRRSAGCPSALGLGGRVLLATPPWPPFPLPRPARSASSPSVWPPRAALRRGTCSSMEMGRSAPIPTGCRVSRPCSWPAISS